MTAELAIDAVRVAVAQLPQDALTPARLAALAKLDERGLPTTRHEDWKYTDLGRVITVSNEWLSAGTLATDVSDLEVARVTECFDADWLVIRNGQVDAASVAAFAAAGVSVELISQSGDSPGTDAPLSDLNVALLRDGLCVRVAADSGQERIIGLLMIDSTKDGVGVSQARVKIEVQPGGSVEILEYHASSGRAAHYANTVVDVDLGPSASVNYVRIQDRDLAHSQTARLSATLSEHSQFHHAAFDLGGDLIRNDLDIRLAGAGSLASFCGLYLAGGTQHIDNHTKVDHLVGPATSQQEYRGILAGAARCVWNGKAIVHNGADGTDAQQANHNLLLSDKAEVDAKPELEIYTDDVKASHGTTIGELDKSALFYLRTRGLDEASARQLLTRAFAQRIVAMSPVAAIQETVSDMVADQVLRLIVGKTP